MSITRCSSGGNDGNFVSGKIKKPIVQGKGQDLAYVLFHVVNFYDFIEKPISLLEQDSSQWKLTLDQLDTAANNVKSLNSQGGFAITHVGKLEKLDGQTFSEEEATEFLKKFADFLSFARGFRVPLILLVGYDAENNEIWQHWDLSVGHSWKSVDSWFPTNKAKILADVFPGFLRWWHDWKESERLVLYSYLEANAIPTVEIKIVLTQIALELIAKKEGQTQRYASEKLRGLFEKHNIPVNIPLNRLTNQPSTFANAFIPKSSNLVEKLIELKSKLEEKLKKNLEKESNEKDKQKIKKELNQVDAPYLFTQIRNDIVHSKKKIENFEDYLFEASDLGLWYLELVLLAIFSYQGCYCNRLPIYQQNGDTEPVPWYKI